MELPVQAIESDALQSNAAQASQRRTAATNRSINLPDRVSETGYLQSSAGDDFFSDMLEGIVLMISR